MIDEEKLEFRLRTPLVGTSSSYVDSYETKVDRAEVGVEWQSDYDTYDVYPTINTADECSEGFYDELGNSTTQKWHQNFNNGDLNSKESHWDSWDDTQYADSVDFAFWTGHGTGVFETPRALRFFVDLFGGMKQSPDKLTWSEIDWGDDDLDWVALNTCRFMKGTVSDLKVMAKGVHLICGYETDMTVFAAAGPYFADRLKVRNIKSAWHDQCAEYQPAGNTSRVLGTNSTMGDTLTLVFPIAISQDTTASSTYILDDYTQVD